MDPDLLGPPQKEMGTSLAAGSGASSVTLGVLELGTNSLKLHLAGEERPPGAAAGIEAWRLEWDVGFEVYSSRLISEETIGQVLNQVQALLGEQGVDPTQKPLFGIATGAFRDAENTQSLMDRLRDEMGIPVRVLTMKEEASLLLEGASRLIPERPAMVFDLGGGSLERVFLGNNGFSIREALPLGAIRIHHDASLVSGAWDELTAKRWIQKALQTARPFRVPEVHGTGGTVKAIAQVAGGSPIAIEDLRRIERAVRRDGAPDVLSERRRQIFLPGLMVVRRLLEHVEARRLHHARVDLGGVLLGRLRPYGEALRSHWCESALVLDVFQQI